MEHSGYIFGLVCSLRQPVGSMTFICDPSHYRELDRLVTKAAWRHATCQLDAIMIFFFIIIIIIFIFISITDRDTVY